MGPNAITEEQAVVLMGGSSSEREWNARARFVKREHGGQYPGWWFEAIVRSGVADRTARRWGGNADIRVTVEGAGDAA